MFVSLAQPTVIGGFRVGTHKRVVDGFFTLIDLPMCFPLVVVPDLPASFGDDGLERQEEAHLPRLEDAAPRVNEWDARAFEVETRAQLCHSQLVADLGHLSDIFEGRKAHPGVVSEKVGGARHCRPNWRPC